MNSSRLADWYWEADLTIPGTDRERADRLDSVNDFADELEDRAGRWAGLRLHELADEIDGASPDTADQIAAAAALRVVTATDYEV